MQTTVLGWKCEYPKCGHVWVSKKGEGPPLRCAGCKKPGWHQRRSMKDAKKLERSAQQSPQQGKGNHGNRGVAAIDAQRMHKP